jgi:hypothetical protein
MKISPKKHLPRVFSRGQHMKTAAETEKRPVFVTSNAPKTTKGRLSRFGEANLYVEIIPRGVQKW